VFYPFGIAPQGGFAPLQTYQALYRIGNITLFPSRPYSKLLDKIQEWQNKRLLNLF